MKQTKTSFLACVQQRKEKSEREKERTGKYINLCYVLLFFLRIKICTVHIERFNVQEEKKSINLTGSIGW